MAGVDPSGSFGKQPRVYGAGGGRGLRGRGEYALYLQEARDDSPLYVCQESIINPSCFLHYHNQINFTFFVDVKIDC